MGDGDAGESCASTVGGQLSVVVLDAGVVVEGACHTIAAQEVGRVSSTRIDIGQSRVSTGDINRNGRRDVHGVLYCPRATGHMQA